MTTRDDEPFEQVLMDAAAGYGAPSGEAPREEMWAAIRARRTTPRLAATPAAPRHVPRTWVWMGMAATLLLGVAVGRFAWQRNAQQVVVSALPASSAPTAGVPVPNAPENQGAPGAAAAAPVSAAPVAPRATRNGRILEGAGSTTYSLVAVRHLADVEAASPCAA